jgi:adenine-specific DNA-methyltransferase
VVLRRASASSIDLHGPALAIAVTMGVESRHELIAMPDHNSLEPEKLELSSLDIAAQKQAELLRLFPEVRTEGGKIDFDRLRSVLGEMVDGGRERYGMTWPGKAECMRTIQAPSMGTLLPVREESVDWDTTENVIIEGDNLEVLKLLQRSYLGKVKMIYIDPPYNTGNDFIYPDNYAESLQTYLEYTGQVDAQGRKFGTNLETDGRFHSRWLNMMLPRLYLARQLLADDGAMFISINDVEAASLKKLCDEVFGEECLIAQFIWNNEGNIDNQSKVKVAHEYILCYSKQLDGFVRPTVIDPNIEESSKLYNDQIENSITKNGPANPPTIVELPVGFPASLNAFTVKAQSSQWPKVLNDIKVANGVVTSPARVESGWSSRNLLDLFITNGCVPIKDAEGKETWFAVTPSGAIYGYKKRSDSQGHVLSVIRNVGTTKQNSNMLAAWGIDFPYPKPTRLIQWLVEVGTAQCPDALVLDFFAGSGTLAHAVWNANKRDGGARRFVMIQLPELIKAGTANYESGFRTIADITRHRAVKAAEEILGSAKVQSATNQSPPMDVGFRYFKLAPSNFVPWDGTASNDAVQLANQLQLGIQHTRYDRTPEDLLYEVLLKSCGENALSLKLAEETIEGVRIFSIANGAFLICLEEEVSMEFIRALAARKPDRVVMRESAFAGNDQLKTNASHSFKAAGVTSFKVV